MKDNNSPLTDEEIAQLVRFGECFLHTHPRETLGFAERRELMAATPTTSVSTTPYSPGDRDEILLVDTTGGAISVVLPVANKGREFRVIRVAGSANVTVTRSGADTINGATSLTVSSSYTPTHLKAIFGTGYITI